MPENIGLAEVVKDSQDYLVEAIWQVEEILNDICDQWLCQRHVPAAQSHRSCFEGHC